MSDESINLDWWTNLTPELRAAAFETAPGKKLKAVFARHDALTALQNAEKVQATCEREMKALTDERAKLDRQMVQSEQAQVAKLKIAQGAVVDARTALNTAEDVLRSFDAPPAPDAAPAVEANSVPAE